MAAGCKQFNLTAQPQNSISGNNVAYTIAPLSVNHLVLRKSTVLPVRLLRFEGKTDNGSSVLSWKTASETAGGKFILLRSCNGGGDWVTIATIPAANGSAGGAYAYKDVLPVACNNKTTAYRLVMAEADGNTAYSNIVTLTAASATVQLFPNPANDAITVIGLPPNAASIAIRNVHGQVIKRVDVGRTAQVVIPIGTLSPNTYWLEVLAGDKTVRRLSFVKM